MIRDNVGIPIELAIAAVDTRLREEGIRNKASVIAAGGFRNSADVIKAIALGADAVYIGTAALVAMGCHVCQKCYTGKCNWGIATQDPHLEKRLTRKSRHSACTIWYAAGRTRYPRCSVVWALTQSSRCAVTGCT